MPSPQQQWKLGLQQEHQGTVSAGGKETDPICTPQSAVLDQLSLFQHEGEKGDVDLDSSKSLET